MILAFELTMPRRGSWNGGWSGENDRYIITKMFRTKKAIAQAVKLLEQHSFCYSWNDGWTARVTVTLVDSKQAAKLRKVSKGFCGYNWMVDTILQYGTILASHEIGPYLESQKSAKQD